MNNNRFSMGLMRRLALMLTWALLAAFCSAQQQKGWSHGYVHTVLESIPRTKAPGRNLHQLLPVCRIFLAMPCAGLPTWLGKAAGAAASKAGYDGAFLAQTHPFKFLEMLADMPPMEQKVFGFVEGVSVEILTAAVCCSLSCCHTRPTLA